MDQPSCNAPQTCKASEVHKIMTCHSRGVWRQSNC